MDAISLGFFGLFIVTFLSATILPFSSEIILIAFLSKGFEPINCFIIASLGNCLGGLTNYGLGRLGKLKWLYKLGVSDEKLNKFCPKIQKYGGWLALLSWIPIIGDPLVVALGYFRTSFLQVLILLVIGKVVRYWLIVQFYWS